MAKLLVRIEVPGPAAALRKEIEHDRHMAANGIDTNRWFSPLDGGRIAVDDACVDRSESDDSFLLFDLVAVEDDQ